MKFIRVLLVALVLAQPAHAAPMLVVDATLTEKHADGSKDIVQAPPLTLASGMKGVMKMGTREWTVTPTLKEGSLVVPMMLTRRQGEKEIVEARPQVVVQPGQLVEIEIGDLTFKIRITLAP